MGEILEFGKPTAPQASLNEPEALTPEKEESMGEGVREQLLTAFDLNLDECVIIGSGGGFLHYLNSSMTTERIIYLIEKYKASLLRDEYEEYNN